MKRDAKDIQSLVARELAAIKDPPRREALARRLVAPQRQERLWDYGVGEITYSCWLVAVAPERALGLAYCEWGFGPQDPWGIVSLASNHIGSDDHWFRSLEDAFIGSGLWSGPLPPDYEVG